MDLKRVFRAPLFWVLAVIAITVLMFSFDSNGGYSKITTAQAEQLISDGKVDKALFTSDNVLNLDLKSGESFTDKSTAAGSFGARNATVGPEPDTIAAIAPSSRPASSTWRSSGRSASAAGSRSLTSVRPSACTSPLTKAFSSSDGTVSGSVASPSSSNLANTAGVDSSASLKASTQW